MPAKRFDSPIRLEVDGLDETRRALRRVDQQKTIQVVNKQAADMVRDLARAKWQAQPSPKTLPGRARSVISSSGTQRDAAVVLRYGRYPWAAGGEFGSLAHRQFRRWRGNQWTDPSGSRVGWVIHPALRELLPRIVDDYADDMVDEFNRRLDEEGVPRSR